MVGDGEIAGMLGAIETFQKRKRILLLADSKVAINAIQNACKIGKARTIDLKHLIEAIDNRNQIQGEEEAVAVGWVKSHIGMKGNELANKQVKKGARKRDRGRQVTEGEVRQRVMEWKQEVRRVVGFGEGRIMS